MSVSSIAAIAQQGVQTALARFDKHAQDALRTAQGRGEPGTSIANLAGDKQAAEANLKVMQAADDMMGVLFDLKV